MSAGAAPCCEFHEEDVESVQCCDDCPHEDDEFVAASADGLDLHAALNTYETSAPAGIVLDALAATVVGTNGRRLLARRLPEGVWLGGCLLADTDRAALAAWLMEGTR